MNSQKNLIHELFKDTFSVFVMLAFVASIGNVIDGIIIGKFLGSSAIAAFGFTNPYQKFTAIFPNIFSMGMQFLVSQHLGKGELKAANGIFSLAMIFGTGLAIFFIAVSYIFPYGIAEILGAEESLELIRTGTIDYFQAYSLGLPAMTAVALLTPIIQLDGERKRAINSVMLLSAANVLGDLLVIFYFNGELWSIGIVTSIAYYLSAGFLMLHFFKPEASFKFSSADIKIKNLREIFWQGSPMVVGCGASMLCSRFLNSVALSVGGSMGVAAVAIWDNIFSVTAAFPSALAATLQIISGLFISEHDKKSVLRLAKFATKYSLKISIIVSIILFFVAPELAQLYTKPGHTEIFFAAVEAIRWIALSVVFVTLGSLIQYFYQAYNRFELVNIMTLANNLILIVPPALLLTPYFKMTGLWTADIVNRILFLILIIVGVWFYFKKITFKLEDILLLPKDFGSAGKPQMNMLVTFKDDDLSISEVVEVFLEKNNISRRKTMFASICVEEMVNNILEHGFNDGQEHSIDVRIIIHNEEIIIRIRDDCRPFNPKKWHEIYNPANPVAHIGIRLVAKMAKEIQYVNVLKLNNLIIKI